MDKSYMKGELLQLLTKNSEVVEGRFFSTNNDKSKISLYNVKESSQDKSSESVLHFYNSEIRDIVKLPDPERKKQLRISPKDVEDILLISKKYIFINQVDNNYHEAVKDLEEYEFIAMSTDGANMGRKCKLPFLVLSSPYQIYIFDIEVMQYHAFDAGLRKLLEGDSPKKIVHDCRKISDCLFHKHHVRLNAVFDTQVGDVIVTKNKVGGLPNSVRSLPECLNYYLGVQDFIEEKLDIVQCTGRPLSTQIKENLSKNIAFLHRLSEIIHDQLMLPFVRGVECYIENIRSCDDFKAWELGGKLNQLPKEFKNAIDY